MTEPADMIVPVLREMRAENAELHKQTRELVAVLDKRLGAVKTAQKSHRAAVSADTLLSKLVAGGFERRIDLLERKVRELQGIS
jgi:hypothetical protein